MMRGSKDDNITSKEIYDVMMKNEKLKDCVENEDTYKTKKEDPTELLGEKDQYTSKTSFKDRETELNTIDTDNNIMIVVFKNTMDAETHIKGLKMVREIMIKNTQKKSMGHFFYPCQNLQIK